MHRPPDALRVGEYFSQEEIEESFNTGFGYRISGINPRRDSNDNRYLLVFSNEDGPYDDSVRQGQFEYIGEGLEGNQSEDSPGNSALIDAVSADFPVYFFYSETDRPEWEYQGQVIVLGFRHEERDGRQVLVFNMEHQDGSSSSHQTPGLYLIPVNDDWRERFRNSVEEPHNLQQYGDVPPQIEGIDRLRIWGTTETDGDKKQSAIDHMSPDDGLLFYHDGEFFAGGTVGRTLENPDVGELLWNNPESRYLFTVENFTHSVPAIEVVWDMLGYKGRQVVQGFTRVADERVSNIRGEHGSLESLIHGTDEEPSQKEIEEEKSELARAIESEPELTKDDTDFVETRRKARDHAFQELVRNTYNNTCAVCGSQRESPDGDPEVEAAHIYPHSEGGSDDIRNGIALCKLHHWALDSGWLSFTDDHEIIVAEAPDKNGYHELKQLEGRSLRLPENEDAHPYPMFLEQHREIQHFD